MPKTHQAGVHGGSEQAETADRNMSERRRDFLGAAILAAGTAVASRSEAQPGTPGCAPGRSLAGEIEPIARSRDKARQLATFDPAVGGVPNPGMGVCGYVYSDHMHVGRTGAEWNRTQGLPPLPLDKKSLDDMAALPHVDKLYIRVEWRDIQKQKGRLAIPAAWEWMLEAAQRTGKSWGFRVMSISPHSMHPNSLPDFLQNKVKMTPYWHRDNVPGPRPKFNPDYGDVYMGYWAELLELLGGTFDNDPRLEFADISGYGHWGEWHHGANYEREGGPAGEYYLPNRDQVVHRLIEDHLRAFPLTPAVLNLHAAQFPPGYEAFVQGRVWARRDSFMSSFSPAEARLAQGLTAGQAMLWETIMPLQPQSGNPRRSRGLQQRYFDIQGHYATVGFNPWDMIWAHQHMAQVLGDFQQNLGYRLRPAIVWRRSVDNGPPELVVGLRNDGCAPPPGVLQLEAMYPGGRTATVQLPLGQPAPGALHLFSLPYLYTAGSHFGKPECRLALSIRMKGKSRPVQWAVGNAVQDRFKLSIPLL